MNAYRFGDRNMPRYQLGDFERFRDAILDIDRENSFAEMLFRFQPYRPIVLHRYKAPNKMPVIEPDGNLKEIRSAGKYIPSSANSDPLRECNGEEGAVAFFIIRCNSRKDVLYELPDDRQDLIGILAMSNFIHLAKGKC